MPIFATAGTRFYIGATIDVSDDLTEASFASPGWTEVQPMESLGSIGDSAEPITFDDIAASRRRKLKGTRDAGTMEIIAGIDYSDPGQLALIAAEKTDDNYMFRLVFDDAPTGGTPSERLFGAIVGGATEALDVSQNVMKLNASLWVNSNVVRINAES